MAIPQGSSADHEFLPTRQSLLSRLGDWDDHASWKRFFDTYWKLIYQTAIKSGLEDAEAQDVVQETVISVCKSVRTFEYQAEGGSFKGWLLKLTEWRIRDQYRKRQRGTVPVADDRDLEGVALDRMASPSRDLETIWNEEWHKNLLAAALQRVRKRVDSKHYQIFDLYVFKDWPIARLTRTFSVSAARIYLIKHRISGLIRKEIKLLETRPL